MHGSVEGTNKEQLSAFVESFCLAYEAEPVAEGLSALSEKRVLLIVGGGIAAYKALELTRLLRKAGVAVRVVLTAAGAEFVTPLSLAALSEDRVYQELFSLTDEAEMGHILQIGRAHV